MNTRKEIIPNNLKEYRLKVGLTQKQVAEMMGLKCEDRISHWEKGYASPSVLNLLKLCEIYRISAGELYPINF